MIEELKQIENLVLKAREYKIQHLIEDKECKEYFGYNFQLNQLKIKFRKEKITPKKAGQFVTLWKRNAEQQTEPFGVRDEFDFLLYLQNMKINKAFSCSLNKF